MSKRQLSALLGFWVIIFLFLGFPIGWDKWIAVVTGLLIILVAYKKVSKKTSSNNAFVQNNVVNVNNHVVSPTKQTSSTIPERSTVEPSIEVKRSEDSKKPQ